MTLHQPCRDGGRDAARGLPAGTSRYYGRREQAQPVPASALGRPAPAGDDRHGADERTGIIIADEPTTALDVTIQAQILRLLADLQREFGMAMILITHIWASSRASPIRSQSCTQVKLSNARRPRAVRRPATPVHAAAARLPAACGRHGTRLAPHDDPRHRAVVDRRHSGLRVCESMPGGCG